MSIPSILICGTQCTGKKTFIKLLNAELLQSEDPTVSNQDLPFIKYKVDLSKNGTNLVELICPKKDYNTITTGQAERANFALKTKKVGEELIQKQFERIEFLSNFIKFSQNLMKCELTTGNEVLLKAIKDYDGLIKNESKEKEFLLNVKKEYDKLIQGELDGRDCLLRTIKTNPGLRAIIIFSRPDIIATTSTPPFIRDLIDNTNVPILCLINHADNILQECIKFEKGDNAIFDPNLYSDTDNKGELRVDKAPIPRQCLEDYYNSLMRDVNYGLRYFNNEKVKKLVFQLSILRAPDHAAPFIQQMIGDDKTLADRIYTIKNIKEWVLNHTE